MICNGGRQEGVEHAPDLSSADAIASHSGAATALSFSCYFSRSSVLGFALAFSNYESLAPSS